MKALASLLLPLTLIKLTAVAEPAAANLAPITDPYSEVAFDKITDAVDFAGRTYAVSSATIGVFSTSDFEEWHLDFISPFGAITAIGATSRLVFAVCDQGIYYSRDGNAWDFHVTARDSQKRLVVQIGDWVAEHFEFGSDRSYNATQDFENWVNIPEPPQSSYLIPIDSGAMLWSVGANGDPKYFTWLPETGWQEHASPSTQPIERLVVSDGVILLTSLGDELKRIPQRLYRSSDALNWTEIELPVKVGGLENAKHIGGLYVLHGRSLPSAVGEPSHKRTLHVSTDNAATFHRLFFNPDNGAWDILNLTKLGDTYYAHIGFDPYIGSLHRSTNGMDWESLEGSPIGASYIATEKGFLFYRARTVVPYDSGSWTSTDLVHWTKITPNEYLDPITYDTYHSITLGDGITIAASFNRYVIYEGGTKRVTPVPTAFRSDTPITFGNGLFAFLSEEGVVHSSTNGETWDTTFIDVQYPDQLRVHFLERPRLFVIAESVGSSWTSSNAKDWVHHEQPGDERLLVTAHVGELIFGRTGSWFGNWTKASADGINWRDIEVPAGEILFHEGVYRTVSEISHNGLDWESSAVPGSPSYLRLVNEGFVAVHAGYHTISTDGKVWTVAAVPSSFLFATNGERRAYFTHIVVEPLPSLPSNMNLQWTGGQGLLSVSLPPAMARLQRSDDLVQWVDMPDERRFGWLASFYETVDLAGGGSLFFRLAQHD